MNNHTFRILETVLRLSDPEKKKCLHYLERAKEELQNEINRLKGTEDTTTNQNETTLYF